MSEKTFIRRILKYVIYTAIIGVCPYWVFILESDKFAYAVEVVGNGFNLVSTNEPIFVAENMAPGSSSNGNLSVKNEGEYDFSYKISAVLEDGSQRLYDVLDLVIEDERGQEIYYRKLKDLQNLSLGVLGIGSLDKYNFEIGLPIDCGNEFQGLSCKIKFSINAVEHPPYINGGRIVWDPPLEKPDCNVRKGIIMPISFHIVQEDNTYDTKKRGIELIISGVNSSGEPVSYLFKTADGSLSWDEHGLSHPHYSLKFDAVQYPVLQETYYTATVKYGDQILGQTKFKSGK